MGRGVSEGVAELTDIVASLHGRRKICLHHNSTDIADAGNGPANGPDG